jgi:hypothetical protein
VNGEPMDEELHLEMHRMADELGKFSIHMKVHMPKPMDRETAGKFLDHLLVQITEECMRDGADLIGHVKAFLEPPTGGTLGASLVDLTIGTQLSNGLTEPVTEADLTIHVIVHGLWDPDVRHSSLEMIEKVMAEKNIRFDVIKDYYETEKSIAHHHVKS